MKKALFSLLLTFALLPSAFAQSKAGHVQLINDTACGEYTWSVANHGNGQTYSHDTVVVNQQDSMTYVLNLTMLPGSYDTATAIPVSGDCYATWSNQHLRGGVRSITIRTAGDTLVALRAANNCDSIVRLNVTLTGMKALNIDTTVCVSYASPWGENVTSSINNDNFIYPTANCTYTGTVRVTVNATAVGETQQVSAGCTYMWGDSTIRDTEVHTKTIANGAANGCDSIASIQVTAFSGHTYDTVDTIACERLVTSWGETVTTSGYYSHDTVIDGCTTTKVLNVLIDHNYTDTTAVVAENLTGACSVVWHGQTFTDTTSVPTYAKIRTAAGMCDSLIAAIVTNLTHVEYDTTEVSYCGNSYNWHNRNFNRDSTYAASRYDYTNTANGCTTNNHLNLTFVDNNDTVMLEACGVATYKVTHTEYRGGRLQPVDYTVQFSETNIYTVDANNEPLYTVDWSSKCKTNITANVNIIAPEQRMRATDIVDTGVCDQKEFRFDGHKITITESVTDSIFRSEHHTWSVGQCYDSLVNVNVVVNHKTVTKDSLSACGHYRWDATGVDYTESTTINDTLNTLNESNCRIIRQLRLTINKAPVVSITGETHLLPGGSTTLTAVCDEEGVNYRWYLNNSTNPETNTTNTLQLNNVQSNTDVYLQTTNRNNCKAENWVTVTATVGIDDVDALQVNIYPNPATRFMNIETADAMSTVEVYNALGQKVITSEVNANRTQLDLGSMAIGNYTLRIVSQNGEQTTRKFIVNK